MGSGRIVRWFLETSLAIANWIKIEGRFGRQRPNRPRHLQRTLPHHMKLGVGTANARGPVIKGFARTRPGSAH
jgi:hypothetical protein